MKETEKQVVTCAEMKEIEAKADQQGHSYYKMMELAGSAAAQEIQNYCETVFKGENRPIDVTIFCGKGNNGGDGFVVARKLFAAGMAVTVALTEEYPKSGDALMNADLAQNRGVTVIDGKQFFEDIKEIAEASEILVDAIYGTGFHGELKGTARKSVELVNRIKKEKGRAVSVFSLDLPSGLPGDGGAMPELAVKADYTIAFHRKKPIHVQTEALAYMGNVQVVEIGIPD